MRGVQEACKASRIQRRVLARIPVTIGVEKDDPCMRDQCLLEGSFAVTGSIQKVSIFSPNVPKL